MIRVVAIDDETGERRELMGSRVVLLVGEGDHVEMVQAGDAQDSEVTCEMLTDAHEQVRDESVPVPSRPTTATLH